MWPPPYFSWTVALAVLLDVTTSRVALVTVAEFVTRAPFFPEADVLNWSCWLAPAASEATVHVTVRVDAA